MDIIGRLRGDPEEKPIDPALVVPDADIESDEVVPDEGDADGQKKAEEGGDDPAPSA